MLIVCPSCARRYELDAVKLGADGRKVRCPACEQVWHVARSEDFPPAPDSGETQALLTAELVQAASVDAQISAVAAEREMPEEPLDMAPDTAPVAEPVARRKPVRSRTSRKGATGGRMPRDLALPAGLLAVGLLIVAGLLWQRTIAVRAAPQLAAVYEALGLPVNVRGLALSAVESNLVDDGQWRFLVVEGDVTNIAKGRNAVPLIEVAVKDVQGQTLYTWTTEAPRDRLEPSELVRFRARLASPPEEGRSVAVRFVSRPAPDMAKLP